MKILAGTSKGVFSIEPDGPRQVLESRGVREIVKIDTRTFAGTGAGLFISNDAGNSWQPAGLQEREVWQIRSSADGTLYAGTQPTGLFKSLDQGLTWQEIDSFSNFPEAAKWCIPMKPVLPAQARALVIDPNNSQRLWVGVEVGGIMRTEDGGDSWQYSLPCDNPDLHMMCAHPTKPEVLFASTGYGRLEGIAEMVEGNAGVQRSDDGGQSWKYVWRGITPRYSRPMCIDPRPPFGLTVGSAPTPFSNYKQAKGAQAMLFRSEDEGESWRSLCDPGHSPSAANFHGLTADPEIEGGILVGTDSGEIWRVSNDAQWEQLATGLPAVFSLYSQG